MKIVFRAVLAVLVAFAIPIGLVAVPGVIYLGHSVLKCKQQHDLIVAAWERLDPLGAGPPGAALEGTRSFDCDSDDHFASAGQSFRAPEGASGEDPEAFYRAFALRHGWRLAPSEGAPGEECLVKDTEDAQVELMVTGEGWDRYTVSLSTWPC